MAPRFVVHEHKARRLHYDFRLEVGGVLRSWAVPKGPSMNPADKRLAIAVPDHPLDYADFEGIIPAGHYGAGPVVVWDEGTWEPAERGSAEGHLRAGALAFVLHGRKLRGAFALARLRRSKGGGEWLLVKKKDEEAEPRFTLKTELTRARLRRLAERVPSCDIS
jgi:bifunctional non-homologous end joining protein LigD